jgi:DNA-binding LytR/AlgR family response regulator
MTIRAVLVDDEKPARDRLRRLLRDHRDVEIVGEASDVAGAVEAIDALTPDLVFLDVRIPGGDGFEVLSRIHHKPAVVFTTAFDRYAVRAFEVNSVDYLLKPFDRGRFSAALEKARGMVASETEGLPDTVMKLLEAIRSEISGLPSHGLPSAPSSPQAAQTPFRLPARRGAKIVLLDPAEILWFEAEDTIVHACTSGGRFLVDRPLAELERSLGTGFFRSHRSVLLNLAQVGEIVPSDGGTYRVILRDAAKSTVPLSRRQAQKLREILPW